MNINVTKRILFYPIQGILSGGADHSISQFIKKMDRKKNEPVVVFKKSCHLNDEMISLGIETIVLDHEFISTKKTAKSSKILVNKSFVKDWKVKKYIGSFLRDTKKLFHEMPIIYKIIKNNNIELVYLNLSLPLDRAGVIAGLLCRKKVVCHIRNFQRLRMIDVFLSRYIKKIICVSDAIKSEYIKQGVSPEKLVTIYNGANLSSFKNIKVDDRAEFVVGNFGRMIEWKGQKEIIFAAEEVLKTFSNIKFVIAGEGPERVQLKNYIEKQNLSKNIKILNYQKDVVKFLSEIDIFVYPSNAPDPCPRAIIEAMAAGKAIITSNLGGIPEEIGNTGVLLEDPKDHSEMAKEIIRFLDKDRVKEFGERAKERATSLFDIDITNKKIDKIITRILIK